MTRGGPLGRAVAAIWFALTLVSISASAETLHRVVLLADVEQMAANSELLTRLRAELSAARFDVVVLPTPAGESAKLAVETAGRELNPAAVVLVRERYAPELGGSVAELWMSDRIGRRTLMQSMMLDPSEHSRDMSLLAVQTVELVKARLAALTLPDGSAAPVRARPVKLAPPATKLPEPVAPAPVSERERARATLAAGAGLLQDLGGMNATFAPVLRAGVYLPELGAGLPDLELRVSAAATVKQLDLRSGPGSARVNQAFGSFDVQLHLAPRHTWHPVLSLGSGVFRVGVKGEAMSPYPTHRGTSWSALSMAGAGLWAQAAQGLAWIVDAHVLAAWYPTRVIIDGARVGHVGAPALFLSTGVVGLL